MSHTQTASLYRIEGLSFYIQGIAKAINQWAEDQDMSAEPNGMALHGGDILMLTTLLTELAQEQQQCLREVSGRNIQA